MMALTTSFRRTGRLVGWDVISLQPNIEIIHVSDGTVYHSELLLDMFFNQRNAFSRLKTEKMLNFRNVDKEGGSLPQNPKITFANDR